MKLFSCAVAACRYFSSKTAAYNKVKKSANYYVSKNSTSKSGNVRAASRVPKIKLTDQQKEVFNAICSGKSVFITGSAGTGKTFFLRHIIKALKKIHPRSEVFVTASTGVAACALNGMTLHSFAGVGLAEADRHTLLTRLDKNAQKRWHKAKVLIIDEASMVDAELFDTLEYIARAVRCAGKGADGDRVWGGIQLVVSGDFLQLPPVLNRKRRRAKDGKEFAFEADCWNASFDIQTQLAMIFRQSNAELIKMLQGIRKGEIDMESLDLLIGCCSASERDPSAVCLYPRIDDVNEVNKIELHKLHAEIYIYSAVDYGDNQWKRQLKQGMAPDKLELCIGARVMLIKNLDPWRKLVNGATGTVVDFRKVYDDKNEIFKMCDHGSVLPVVKFDSGLKLDIGLESWIVMDGDKVVATRRQIPLILSWALSIHKCQGMTLDRIHTDLSRAFGFGMVYVAISRVKTLEGLHISGFNPGKIKAHPKVLQFYHSFSSPQKMVEE